MITRPQSTAQIRPQTPPMAPIQPRKSVAKDRFSALFSTLKTQTYYDPSARGPGSHAYVFPSHTFSPATPLFEPPQPQFSLRDSSTDILLSSSQHPLPRLLPHRRLPRHRFRLPHPSHLEPRKTLCQAQHRTPRPHWQHRTASLEPRQRLRTRFGELRRDLSLLGCEEQELQGGCAGRRGKSKCVLERGWQYGGGGAEGRGGNISLYPHGLAVLRPRVRADWRVGR